MDARAVAPDVEDAVGQVRELLLFGWGHVVDSDAGEDRVGIDILGRKVTDPHPERDSRACHGIDGLAQVLFGGGGEDKGGCDARVRDSSTRGVPVEVEEGRIGKSAGDGIGGV